MLIIPYWERKAGKLETQGHISGQQETLSQQTNKNHTTTTKQVVAQAGQHSGVQGQLG